MGIPALTNRELTPHILPSNVGRGGSVQRLPNPELARRQVAVFKPLTFKRDPASTVVSFILHGAILALILWFAFHVHEQIVAPKAVAVVPIQIQPYIPVTAPAPKTMGGGGGGGAREAVPPVKGHLPPVAKAQVVPIETLKVDHPRLAATPTVQMPQRVKLQVATPMPNFGDPQAPQIALSSQSAGSGAGFGQGGGGGIGSGQGAGVGVGTGGGYGGGVMSVGGGVMAPRLIHRVDPEFTEAARRARYQGVVSVRLIVDSQGNPEDIQVVRHLGMGMDQKVIEAVQQYKFSPAMYRGHPVAVQIVIDVNFNAING